MKIGDRQQVILTAMAKNGNRYWPGCGIVWGNFSTTRRIIDSLVEKDLVRDLGNNYYALTQKGKELGDPHRYIKERVIQILVAEGHVHDLGDNNYVVKKTGKKLGDPFRYIKEQKTPEKLSK